MIPPLWQPNGDDFVQRIDHRVSGEKKHGPALVG